MSSSDCGNPYQPPSAEAEEALPARKPLVHMITVGSILCSVAGVDWALAVTLGHEKTLRSLQNIFIGVAAAGFCAGVVAVRKAFAVRLIDRLLATTSSFASLVVLIVALLVPWLDTIERAYVQWSGQ